MPTRALTAGPPMYLNEHQLTTHIKKTRLHIVHHCIVFAVHLRLNQVLTTVLLTLHIHIFDILLVYAKKIPPPLRTLLRYLLRVAVKVSFSRLFSMTQVTAVSADMLMDRTLVML